ncbi:MAG TPA: SigE family RNA polymerase sigma factor [Trebonia sp.]|jgi:RNA polymerase sigma-70 factor (sigma-E family)|nr:SigE family RNA polymerase sigma factor [Trebonia sp.]
MNKAQERAFEQFVAQAGDGLLRLATLLTSDRGLGEDAYQETLHRLAGRWPRVDNPGAYSRKILHNVVIDQARKQQRGPAEVHLVDAHDDGDPRGLDRHAAAEIRPVLLDALGALTPQQRAIVVLRYFDDRSEQETAGLLGVSAGTVKSTASRAMARLRQQPALLSVISEDDERKVRYA